MSLVSSITRHLKETTMKAPLTLAALGLALSLSACGAAAPAPAPDTSTPPAAVQSTPAAPAPAPDGTPAQRNALKKAQSYVDLMGFSRDGLIKQLEFDQFATPDAVWAVDHAAADWNAEAAQKATSYLQTMAFSHGALVDQLVFDGFTAEQAEYGVAKAGL